MAQRFFLVGTDTNCGKTTVACAMLRAAQAAGVRAVPFKPAASGETPGDPERLVAAAAIDGLTVDEICPLRYAAPVAPGLAASGGLASFEARNQRPGFERATPEIGESCERLGALEKKYRPSLTVIEGAGGLLVPMPGGSWLPAWIHGFGAQTIVVGRLGLGTINHCLLTFAVLEQFGVEPRGFILAQTHLEDDPSHAHNERVIVATSGVPCLGVLAFGTGEQEHGWLRGGVKELLK